MIDYKTIVLSDDEIEAKDQLFKKLRVKYRNYKDPWGFDLSTIENAINLIYPLFLKYFKVRTFGAENIKDETYMVVSNHTGQIPIDGVLITTSFALHANETRILHSMIERFMAALPFLGDLSAKAGSILGDRENCKWLLRNNESILVFPEGVRGISKSTKDFYKLQRFSSGFYRIALESKVKILPVAVIGAEEMFPFVFHSKSLAKFLNLPSLPLSANLLPLPSPIDIYFGEPIELNLSLNRESSETLINPEVSIIENKIKEMIKTGLENRRNLTKELMKSFSNNNLIKRFLKDS